MQAEAPCSLVRRQLVEDHQRSGPICERRPNGACLAVVQRRKQGAPRIASQYTDLPTPDGRRDLRLTRAAHRLAVPSLPIPCSPLTSNMHAYIMRAYDKILDRCRFSFSREARRGGWLRAARAWQVCAPAADERWRLAHLLLTQDRHGERRAPSAVHGDRQSRGRVDLSAAYGAELHAFQERCGVPKM